MEFFATIIAAILLSTVEANPSCNDNLETTATSPRATNDFFLINGPYGAVELNFATSYFTGLSITVNTESEAPCTFVETSIDLREYQLLIDGRPINIPIRSSFEQFNQTSIRVAFPPIKGSNVEVTKLTPLEDLPRYCVQYKLYGCSTAPNECRALLSYDTTAPSNPDSTYNGNCNDNWCSGGLGMLSDGNFTNSLSWNGSADFRLVFYQSVGVISITINFSTSTSNVTPSPMSNMVIKDKEMIFTVNRVIDTFTLNLKSTSSFSIQEITVHYWTPELSNNFPCTVVTIPETDVLQFIIPIVTAFAGVVVGIVVTLLTLRFLWNTKFEIPMGKRRKRACEDMLENKPDEERSNHYYTDAKSGTSVVRLNTVRNMDLHEEGRRRIKEASMSLENNSSLDTAMNVGTLTRHNPVDGLDNDNPIYDGDQTQRPNGEEVIQRTESEIKFRDNCKYDSISRSQKQELEKSPEKEVVFENYDKLNH